MDFASLDLPPSLLGVVSDQGWTTPTPIQAAGIPVLLEGRDLIGQSKTGSGKTAAFALPLLRGVHLDRRSLQALVICPTRELAAQVAGDIRTLGAGLPGLAVVELVGGHPARPQRDALARGVHVAVGTPGRLQDLQQSGSLDTTGLALLVLDEADRMLDMGFGPDVEAIVAALPTTRQTALFSATFPPSIEAMSAKCQSAAVRVTISEPALADVEIRQVRLDVAADDRFHGLCWLLHEFPHESALIFCNFKATVTELVTRLSASGASVDRLDGDVDQFHRDQVLARFRNGSIRLLVATDVAGRGLDIEGLDLVVNFELPQQPEVYLHRIGRTGRAGRKGVAASLTTIGRGARLEAIQAMTGAPLESLAWEGAEGLDTLQRALSRNAAMTTILISGGRKDKVRRGDILGALTGDAGGLAGDAVGRIEVQDRISYVAVASAVGRAAVDRLNRGRIKGKSYKATLVGGGQSDGRGSPPGRGGPSRRRPGGTSGGNPIRR